MHNINLNIRTQSITYINIDNLSRIRIIEKCINSHLQRCSNPTFSAQYLSYSSECTGGSAIAEYHR